MEAGVVITALLAVCVSQGIYSPEEAVDYLRRLGIGSADFAKTKFEQGKDIPKGLIGGESADWYPAEGDLNKDPLQMKTEEEINRQRFVNEGFHMPTKVPPTATRAPTQTPPPKAIFTHTPDRRQPTLTKPVVPTPTVRK